MAVVICLLRGVNVGGNHQIRMDSLRTLCESFGFKDVRTYVQSGNVVFQTSKRDFAKLSMQIEAGIYKTAGFRPDAILRTTADLQTLVAANPFACRDAIEPSKLGVVFLKAAPGPEARESLRAMKTDPEELRIGERDLYIYFPNGMGKSRLQMKSVDKLLGTTGSVRNWNTVTSLLKMAQEME